MLVFVSLLEKDKFSLFPTSKCFLSEDELVLDKNIKMALNIFLVWRNNWKITIFWDITPCSSLNVNRRFGGTYSLHSQCGKHLATCFHAGFLCGLFFDREDGDDMFLQTVLFITTAVRTSNLTI
jgi:hypothetical protein